MIAWVAWHASASTPRQSPVAGRSALVPSPSAIARDSVLSEVKGRSGPIDQLKIVEALEAECMVVTILGERGGLARADVQHAATERMRGER